MCLLCSSDADVYSQAASNLVSGNSLEQTIQQILDMGGGTWDRDTVVRALRAAFNNPERAIDYLYSVSSIFVLIYWFRLVFYVVYYLQYLDWIHPIKKEILSLYTEQETRYLFSYYIIKESVTDGVSY